MVYGKARRVACAGRDGAVSAPVPGEVSRLLIGGDRHQLAGRKGVFFIQFFLESGDYLFPFADADNGARVGGDAVSEVGIHVLEYLPGVLLCVGPFGKTAGGIGRPEPEIESLVDLHLMVDMTVHDKGVDHAVCLCQIIAVGDRGRLFFLGVGSGGAHGSIPLLGEDDARLGSIVFLDKGSQDADVFHADDRRGQRLFRLPVHIRPEARLRQRRAVGVERQVPVDVALLLELGGKGRQHLAGCEAPAHAGVPQVVERDVDAGVGVDARHCVVCHAERVRVDLGVLLQRQCPGVVVDAVIVDLVSDDPVDNAAVLRRIGAVPCSKEGERRLQFFPCGSIRRVPRVEAVTSNAPRRIDQGFEIVAPAQQKNRAHRDVVLLQRGQLSVVAVDERLAEPVGLPVVVIRVGEGVVLLGGGRDQLGKYDIHRGMLNVQIDRVLEHIGAHLQSLLGDCLRKRVFVLRGLFGIGYVARVADDLVRAAFLFRDYETGVQKGGLRRVAQLDGEVHLLRLFRGGKRHGARPDPGVGKREREQIAFLAADLFGVGNRSFDLDLVGLRQTAAGDLGGFVGRQSGDRRQRQGQQEKDRQKEPLVFLCESHNNPP